ncbi:MAG: hypothetical protein ACWGQW_15780, partial [bacterium]
MEDGDRVVFCGRDFAKEDRIYGMWYLEMTDDADQKHNMDPHSNVTALLVDQIESKKFMFVWRVRMYMDAKEFPESNDRIASFSHAVDYDECPDRETAVKMALEVLDKWMDIWEWKEPLAKEFVEMGWVDPSEFARALVEKPPKFLKQRKASLDDVNAISEIDPDAAKKLKDKLLQEEGRKRFRLWSNTSG